ncbi:histidinol-phosphatase HisJ [Halobacillus campisalis]|uniref:Histidinol-phosphatase n=1 Tax=Halobacillus campisalis TaxID=435909 RepID=A0ABW2K2F5_9BACI|nr:histidinol-phosphatase HisJ [Halobacillus campisalis]
MYDGHIHTPYCPHGSNASIESYIEQAIKLGYSSMCFTEHAPLPLNFEDPVPDRDSAMSMNNIESYIEEINQLKRTYESDIKINLGLEVDYIKGFEQETAGFLDEYGPYLDDSILSVHFLEIKNKWYCIDFSKEMYKSAKQAALTNESLYKIYFQVLEDSALKDLGPYKPNRIGHMSLIKKFQKIYAPPANWTDMAESFLDIVKRQGLSLDYNGAGLVKEYCKESYPPAAIAALASKKGIPLIYGSDAHHPQGLKQGYSQLESSLISKSP